MRSKNEILVDAEKRIAHLEYFDSVIGLKESQRADLALLKELVALAILGGQYEWERDIAIEQLHELGIGFGAKVDHIKEALERTQWIPCSGTLPIIVDEPSDYAKDVGRRFLITDSDGYVYESTFWKYANAFDDDVIAWQPLPEAYKGE